MRRHGLELPLHLAGRDDQAVGVIGAAGDVEQDDVLGLVVLERLHRRLDDQGQAIGGQFLPLAGAGGAGQWGYNSGWESWVQG